MHRQTVLTFSVSHCVPCKWTRILCQSLIRLVGPPANSESAITIMMHRCHRVLHDGMRGSPVTHAGSQLGWIGQGTPLGSHNISWCRLG